MRVIQVCVYVCVCMNIYVCAASTRAYIHILNYTYIYENVHEDVHISAPRFTSLSSSLFASYTRAEGVIFFLFWIVFDLPLESCGFPSNVERLSC